LAHAGSDEVVKPRVESRPGVEYELWEDGIQSSRLSWIQASKGSSQLLWPKGFRDAVIPRCWNLPSVDGIDGFLSSLLFLLPEPR